MERFEREGDEQAERFERGDECLRRIITTDKTWISLYEPETKKQSAMWKTPGSPSPKKFKVSPSKKKQISIVLFDADGVILSLAVPHGQTITALYYSKVKQIEIFMYSFIVIAYKTILLK